MAKAKKTLFALASGPLAGVRHQVETVPEWENATVILTEHRAEDWAAFQDMVGLQEPADGEQQQEGGGPEPTFSQAEQKRHNAFLLGRVLRDEHGARVFQDDDVETLAGVWGPVHMRLLNKAIMLSNIAKESLDADKKKSAPEAASSS